MAKQTLNIIKNWFRTGLKPSQQQFWDTWDSFWHKDAIIPSGNIENLDKRFDEKADNEALNSHMRDLTAHGLNLKAGLGDQNVFTADNIFINKIKTPKVLTDTGIDFNLDLKNKVLTKGFAGKLTYEKADGTLSFTSTTDIQDVLSDPSFSGAQLRISAEGDAEIQGELTAAGVSFSSSDAFHQYIKPTQVNITADTQLFLPDLSGTLARIEDIPVISAGNNITITGTALNPIINASGGGGGNVLVPVTYAELNKLINNSSLVPEQQYLLTDFQSSMTYIAHSSQDGYDSISYGSKTFSGDVEPLIIKALKKDAIFTIAKSTVYENDEVFYTTKNYNNGLWASTKGTIIKRTDKKLNNTANFDYRVTKYITNGTGEPLPALNLIENCKVKAEGSYGQVLPLIIGEMSNSEFTSSEWNMIKSLHNSKLNMGYGCIISNRIYVYGCEIYGSLFQIYYVQEDTSLSYIYSNSGQYNYYILNDLIIKYLANKSYPSYVVYSEGEFYLQNNSVNGVTTTKLAQY